MFIHIPISGDHYSPATGSAVMTAIHQFALRHAEHGGVTRLIVNQETRHDYVVFEAASRGTLVIATDGVGNLHNLLVRKLENFDEVRWGYANKS